MRRWIPWVLLGCVLAAMAGWGAIETAWGRGGVRGHHSGLSRRQARHSARAGEYGVGGGDVKALTDPGAVEDEPDENGTWHVRSASALGGKLDDQIADVLVAPDGVVVLAGNSVDWRPATLTVIGPVGAIAEAARPPEGRLARQWVHPSAFGFVARFSDNGRLLGGLRFGHGLATITRVRADADGHLYALLSDPAGVTMEMLTAPAAAWAARLSAAPPSSAAPGPGTQPADAPRQPMIVKLNRSAERVLWLAPCDHAADLAVDGNGDLLVLHGSTLTRYAPDGRQARWSVDWPVTGRDHPARLCVEPTSGLAVVVGWVTPMEGARDGADEPYAAAFDRAGRAAWSLWSADPAWRRLRQAGVAATAQVRAAALGEDGRLYLALSLGAGRPPWDVARPGGPGAAGREAFEGAEEPDHPLPQRSAGQVAAVLRLDAATGRIERGTYLAADSGLTLASFLTVEAIAADRTGQVFLAGDSGRGCPEVDPWFDPAREDQARGGFLAVLDPTFNLAQAGVFPATGLTALDQRRGTMIAAGWTQGGRRGKGSDLIVDRPRVHQAFQGTFGGGVDGYFALLRPAAALPGPAVPGDQTVKAMRD